MATIKEARLSMYEGICKGVVITDEKGVLYKLDMATLLVNLEGKKIIKASPKKRIYRHIEKLDWSGGQNVS